MRMAMMSAGLLASGLLAAACGAGSSKPAATSVPTSAPTSAAQTLPATVSAAEATPATNPLTQVNGSVQSVDGNTVTLKDGSNFTLAAQTTILRNLPASLADLVPGKVVHVTAKQQPDNSLLASAIGVDSSASNGTRLGQSPMPAGNLMTNATIDSGSGSSFTVTFPGGGAKVSVAPDAKITTLAPGTAADITAGTSVSAGVLNGVARFVLVG
jgi:predicted component of type VI protein secretion system